MAKKTDTPQAQGAAAAAPAPKPAAAAKKPPEKVKEPKLFVVKTSAMGAVNVRRGEVAIEGAQILRTHPSLFAPLEITYR